jgi:hypothetical protein
MVCLAQQDACNLRLRLWDRPKCQSDEKQIGVSVRKDDKDFEFLNHGHGLLKQLD